MTTIGEYLKTLMELIDELSQFDDDENLEMIESLDGTVTYLVGEEIDRYKESLN